MADIRTLGELKHFLLGNKCKGLPDTTLICGYNGTTSWVPVTIIVSNPGPEDQIKEPYLLLMVEH